MPTYSWACFGHAEHAHEYAGMAHRYFQSSVLAKDDKRRVHFGGYLREFGPAPCPLPEYLARRRSAVSEEAADFGLADGGIVLQRVDDAVAALEQSLRTIGEAFVTDAEDFAGSDEAHQSESDGARVHSDHHVLGAIRRVPDRRIVEVTCRQHALEEFVGKRIPTAEAVLAELVAALSCRADVAADRRQRIVGKDVLDAAQHTVAAIELVHARRVL